MLNFRSIRNLPSAKLTRLAPTPSGFLHMGNIMSFALTAHIAQKTNAGILLRIDDLDKARVEDKYLEDIFDILQFLDIPWTHGPRDIGSFRQTWSQQVRMPLYEKALRQLEANGQVFGCECSRTDVLATRPDGVYPGTCLNKNIDLAAPGVQWRVKTNREIVVNVNRLGAAPLKAQLPDSMQYFVVRRKDGLPAYQLASLIDDVEFGVDLVVRGIDLWPSTWAQLYLAEQLGIDSFLKTSFVHHPLLYMHEGVKLSKSTGSTSIQLLKKHGKSKEQVFAELGRLLGTRETCKAWPDIARVTEQSFAP